MSILFTIPGNQDIKFDGKFIEKEHFRKFTKEIVGDYVKKSSQITLVMLKKIITHYKDINKIVLITSNNTDKEAVDEDKMQDTLYAGEIIRKKLLADYSYLPENIIIHEFQGNATNYEKIYEDLNKLLLGFSEVGDAKILNITTGTPQLKNSMMFLGVNLFGQKNVRVCQVSRTNGEINEVNFTTTITKEQHKITLKKLVNEYEYYAASKHMESSKIEHPCLKNLLDYGHHRLLFNFSEAGEIIDNLLKEKTLSNDEACYLKMNFRFGIEKSVKDYRSKYKKLLEKNVTEPQKHKELFDTRKEVEGLYKDMIVELYRNTMLKWDKGNYVDFVVRISTLEERIYYFLIFEILGFLLETRVDQQNFIENLQKKPKFKKVKKRLVSYYTYDAKRIEKFNKSGDPNDLPDRIFTNKTRKTYKHLLFLILFGFYEDRCKEKADTIRTGPLEGDFICCENLGNILIQFEKMNKYKENTVVLSSNILNPLVQDVSFDRRGYTINKLRNKCIAAHGFEEISQELLEKYFDFFQYNKSSSGKFDSFLKNELKKVIMDLTNCEEDNFYFYKKKLNPLLLKKIKEI